MKYRVVYELETDALLATVQTAVELPKYLESFGLPKYILVSYYNPADAKRCLQCGAEISDGSGRTAWIRNAERLLRRLSWLLQNAHSSNQIAVGVRHAFDEFHRRPPTSDPET